MDELPVPLRGSPGPMEHEHVEIIGQHFNHRARLGLFTGLVGRTGPKYPKCLHHRPAPFEDSFFSRLV